MKDSLAPAVLAVAALVAPVAASAQQLAYTAKPVNMRAGPDRVYPVVAVLPPGAQVAVQGCLPDYRWCDVSYGYSRGWVYAGNLNYAYQQGYATFSGIAPYVGVVILGFALNDYWDRHYHDRSWYRERDYWSHRAPPPRVIAPHQPRIVAPHQPRIVAPQQPRIVAPRERPDVRPPAGRIHPPPGSVQAPPPQIRPPGQVVAPRIRPPGQVVAPQVRPNAGARSGARQLREPGAHGGQVERPRQPQADRDRGAARQRPDGAERRPGPPAR